MGWVLLPTQDQLQNASDVNASGYVIKCYQVGTTTPISMAIDKDGGTTVSTATANADGFWEVSGNEVKLYVDQGTYSTVKVAVYENATDAGNDTNAFWGPIDNLKLPADAISVGNIGPFATYAAARALTSADYNDGDIAKISGDGIEGDFVVKTGTVTDNGGTLIVFTDDSNRYLKRVYHGDIIFDWFEPDKTGATDVYSKFLNAATLSNTDDVFVVLQGNLLFSTTVSTYSKLRIKMRNETQIWADSIAQWILDCPDLVISAGSDCHIGVAGNLFTTYGLYWQSSSQIDNLSISCDSGRITFNGDTTTDRHIACEDATVADQVSIKDCNFDGFTRSGIELPFTTSDAKAKTYIDNCRAYGATDETGSRRGIQVGSNTSQGKYVSVTNCSVVGVAGASTNEVKGIIVYADDIHIDNNYVEDITNTGGDDAEGIYAKAYRGSITNNKLLNAGNSHDGSITVKGDSWPATSGAYNDYLIISNNTVTLDDDAYDIRGIMADANNSLIFGNVLQDLRANRASRSYSIAMGLGGSQNVSNCVCSNNTSNGWVNFIGGDTDDESRSALINNNIIANNTVTNLLGGNAVVWRCDAKETRTMSFSGSAVSIDANSNEFDNESYQVGDSFIVAGSVSNDGTYVITSRTQFSLSHAGSFTTETSTANVSVTKLQSLSLKITGNIFHSNTTGSAAIRHRGGDQGMLAIDGNTYIGFTNAYRIDSTTIDTLSIGSNETYLDLAAGAFNGAPNATNLEYGMVTDQTTGTSTTANGTLEIVDKRGTTHYLITSATLN